MLRIKTIRQIASAKQKLNARKTGTQSGPHSIHLSTSFTQTPQKGAKEKEKKKSKG